MPPHCMPHSQLYTSRDAALLARTTLTNRGWLAKSSSNPCLNNHQYNTTWSSLRIGIETCNMPARIALLSRATTVVSTQSPAPILSFLYPCLQGQRREASILSNLADVPSSYNKRIRRGRGPASGKGKTSGRGHKGQGQHGKVPVGFNGGQTPDEVVAGPRGFTNVFSVEMSPINLDKIQAWIDKGRIDPTQPITLKELNASRCMHGIKDGVKLLARGKEELRDKIDIVVSQASAEAIAAIEKLGGTVTTRYYTKFAIQQIIKGQMDPIHSLASRIELGPEPPKPTGYAPLDNRGGYRYRLPDPISRRSLEYYRDPAKRGYLSYTVEEGKGPSLFFKTPEEKAAAVAGRAKSKTKEVVDRLW